MDAALRQESEKLARSWNQHESAWLKNYLVAGVEDPRVNLQSILTRHFLVEQIFPGAFRELMRHEYHFSAAMNCAWAVAARLQGPEDLDAVRHALKHRSDNAEGIEIPSYLTELQAKLPAPLGGGILPNYIADFFTEAAWEEAGLKTPAGPVNTFADLWHGALEKLDLPAVQPAVLEPACGSANDYRFLVAYGLGRFISYTGFDISEKNIANARALFPGARFETGNAFAIAAPDKAFDICLIQDLFEHLSLEGMRTAVREVCRVTRREICAGFFSMDETREHLVREVDDYHWNTLSMSRMREAFAELGFTGQVFHIGAFLRHQTGCEFTHNPNAYTFWLRSREWTPINANLRAGKEGQTIDGEASL
jgi:SAM-dependent methyltransferase